MAVFYFLFVMAAVHAARDTESGKDLLPCVNSIDENKIKVLRQEMFQATNNAIKSAVKELNKNIKTELQTMKADHYQRNRTIVYTRWGKKTCPSNAELVFSGYVGGSHYSHPGSASEYLCLPRDPEWGTYTDGHDGYKGLIYGAEYETYTYNENFRGMHDHDVPCAVCLVYNRSVVRMFPARKTCYDGWKLEYQGYLMSTYYEHTSTSQFTCVDHHPDSLRGGSANQDGKLFYFVEVVCGSLKCPPYVNGRELVCAVCSKE